MALRQRATLWITVCLIAALPFSALRAGSANGDSPADRLQSDLEYLASDDLTGRATGSEGNTRARNFLIERLKRLGAPPLFDGEYSQGFNVRRKQRKKSIPGYNVIAIFPATDDSKSAPPNSVEAEMPPLIVITAHYDHLGTRGKTIFNGADDNASGVSALLEISRRLATRKTKSDIVIAFLDAEELGFQGARSLVDKLSEEQIQRITLNINLDMIGRSDGGALFVAGLSHTPRLRPAMEKVAKVSQVPLEFGHDTGHNRDNWTLSSDHAAFHQAGVPFLYFGVEDHADYHRPTDDSDRIDFLFLAQATNTIMQTVLAFDSGP